jgi:hypothetical protein
VIGRLPLNFLLSEVLDGGEADPVAPAMAKSLIGLLSFAPALALGALQAKIKAKSAVRTAPANAAPAASILFAGSFCRFLRTELRVIDRPRPSREAK